MALFGIEARKSGGNASLTALVRVMNRTSGRATEATLAPHDLEPTRRRNLSTGLLESPFSIDLLYSLLAVSFWYIVPILFSRLVPSDLISFATVGVRSSDSGDTEIALSLWTA
jgi:hypothetical protein